MRALKTLGIILLVLMLAGCIVLFGLRYLYTGTSDQKALEAAMATPVPTPTPEFTPAPTAEPTPEITPEPTATPEPSATPEPTPDPDSPAGRAAALGLPTPPDIDINSWEFILANAWNNIEEYAPEIETLEQQGFDVRIIEPMKAMVADTRAQGLSVFLSSINAGEIGLAFAMATLYMIPSLLLFLHGEEYLVEGIANAGSVKG